MIRQFSRFAWRLLLLAVSVVSATPCHFPDLIRLFNAGPHAEMAGLSSEELRFATTGADNAKQFQVALAGTVPDIQDLSANLFEIKAGNYVGQPDFIVAQDLGKIHDKAVIAISQPQPGKTSTLAFGVPLRLDTEPLYQNIFKDLINNSQFIRGNGF